MPDTTIYSAGGGALTLVGSNTAYDANDPVAVDLSALTILSGDHIIYAYAFRDDNAHTDPAGYTTLGRGENQQGYGTAFQACYIVASGGETATGVASGPGFKNHTAAAWVFRNASSVASTPDATGPLGTTATTPTRTFTAGSIPIDIVGSYNNNITGPAGSASEDINNNGAYKIGGSTFAAVAAGSRTGSTFTAPTGTWWSAMTIEVFA